MTIKIAQRIRDVVLATIVLLLVAILILLSGCSSPMAPTPVQEPITLSAGGVDTLERPTDCYMMTDSGIVWIECPR